MVPREGENIASVGARWKDECKRHQSGRVPYPDGAVRRGAKQVIIDENEREDAASVPNETRTRLKRVQVPYTDFAALHPD